MTNKIKLILVFVILFLAATSFQLINKKSSNVDLTLAPSVAKAIIDNSKTVKQGKFHLPTGHHTVTVTMSGFADQNTSFDVTSDHITKLVIILIPNSSTGDKWLKDHPTESLRREGLGGQQFDQQINDLAKKYPIISKLPFIDQLFRVDYGVSQTNPNDSSKIAIYIKYYAESGKQQALDWIKFQGYDPNKLEIIYVKGFGS